MGQEKLTIVFNASAGQNRIMTHTWQQFAYIHGLGAELPPHVFNPDKQVYHSLNTQQLSWGSLGLYCLEHRAIPSKPPKREKGS